MIKVVGFMLLLGAVIVLFFPVSKMHLAYWIPASFLVPIGAWGIVGSIRERNNQGIEGNSNVLSAIEVRGRHEESSMSAIKGEAGGGSLGEIIFRWIAVFPFAFLAAIASVFPVRWILYRTLTGSGFIEPYPELPERILGPAIGSAVFVWVGARIAPSHKMIVAFSLLFLYLGVCVTGAFFVGSGIQIEGLRIVPQWGIQVGSLMGAILGTWLVKHQSRINN